MLRPRREMAVEPRRVVLELRPDEYRALETLCRDRSCTVPELVRVVALQLARAD